MLNLQKKKKTESTKVSAAQYVKNDPEFAAKHGYDPYLLSETQPSGNLQYGDVSYHDGMEQVVCINVYSTPDTVEQFWMVDLTEFPGVIGSIDVASEDPEISKNTIDRSMSELESRHSHSREEDVTNANAYQLLDNLLHSLVADGEVVKRVLMRLYVYGHDKKELQERVQNIIDKLQSEEYKAAVYWYETEQQYKALFQPYEKQIKEPNRRVGLGLPSTCVALGYPFNREELDDPHGMYLGSTKTGGNVFLDIFQKTMHRLSYDGLLVGKKGSGKSTTLKLLLSMNALQGNYIRVLDCVGEYTDWAKAYGGIVVTLDGTDGRVNYMECFESGELESTNFSHQMSKLNTFYKFICPHCTDAERDEFEAVCRQLYIEWGLYKPETSMEEQKFTGLDPKQYPTFDDLLHLLHKLLNTDVQEKEAKQKLSSSRRERLENIELAISNLVQSNSMMFSGETTIPSLTNQQIVVYNVKNVSSMKTELFNAVLFNVLNLMIADMFHIGGPSKKMYEDGVPIEKIPKLLLIIDEAQKFINTENPLALKYMKDIVNEGRKFFTSLWFASPSIRAFAPESKEGKDLDLLKSLFELVQYKFIMWQDSNSIPLIQNIFGEELTESELEDIPRMGQGEAILLTGEESLHMNVEADEEDLKLFKGGA